MFKKSTKLTPPQAPNLTQILEDLETFKIDNPTKKLPVSNPSDEWWNTFETFLQDVDQLKDIKSNLITLKERLINVNSDIIKISEDMKNEVTVNLDKAKSEIPDL